MLLVHLFIYFECVNFSLALEVRGRVRLVIVMLPGSFYERFYFKMKHHMRLHV